MTSLVRSQRDSLYIFLDGGIHNLLRTSVMTEMYDLCPGALHDAAHDIDGGIVAIE
jgi:hypothetical protein